MLSRWLDTPIILWQYDWMPSECSLKIGLHHRITRSFSRWFLTNVVSQFCSDMIHVDLFFFSDGLLQPPTSFWVFTFPLGFLLSNGPDRHLSLPYIGGIPDPRTVKWSFLEFCCFAKVIWYSVKKTKCVQKIAPHTVLMPSKRLVNDFMANQPTPSP